MYTAAGMRAHFRLVLDHSDVCLKMVTTQELTVLLFCFILESYKHQVGKIEHLYVSLVQQKTLQALQGSAINKITNIPQCTLPPRPDHPF